MSFHRTIIRLSAVLASLALGWACGGDSATAPEPARPTTVTVSPATHELTALGTTVQLSAEVRDQNARVMAGAFLWACGDDGTTGPTPEPNRAPLAAGTIPAQTVAVGQTATRGQYEPIEVIL